MSAVIGNLLLSFFFLFLGIYLDAKFHIGDRFNKNKIHLEYAYLTDASCGLPYEQLFADYQEPDLGNYKKVNKIFKVENLSKFVFKKDFFDKQYIETYTYYKLDNFNYNGYKYYIYHDNKKSGYGTSAIPMIVRKKC